MSLVGVSEQMLCLKSRQPVNPEYSPSKIVPEDSNVIIRKAWIEVEQYSNERACLACTPSWIRSNWDMHHWRAVVSAKPSSNALFPSGLFAKFISRCEMWSSGSYCGHSPIVYKKHIYCFCSVGFRELCHRPTRDEMFSAKVSVASF